jgi:hypothetical protein
MYNGMIFNIFEGNNILYGYYMSFHFPVVCGTSHNSSRLESYGHEKLENPGLGNGPKFV